MLYFPKILSLFIRLYIGEVEPVSISEELRMCDADGEAVTCNMRKLQKTVEIHIQAADI